jgi:FAD-dependent urate hydroxylase
MDVMTTALIIGGGIAGPVAAMAMQRVGIDVVVYEAHMPTSEEVGSYLTVATNGLDALRAIEADQPVLAVGFPTPYNVLLSGSGKQLGKVTNGGTLPDGTASHTFKRARLYKALHDQAVSQGNRIEYGKRFVGAETTPEGKIVARFEDGSSDTGDLLVGCDGIHSLTRLLIDPNAPNGRYVGLVNFGGYTQNFPPPHEPGAWYMVFGKKAFFGSVVDPSAGIIWFVNLPRPEVSQTERESTSAEQWKQQLAELFTEDQGPASEIIRAGVLELAADNTYDLPKVPTWSKNSKIIIGDAAHAPSPTSGQGASMAMEDGVILAKCLRDLPDTSSAFATLEQLRRQRVEKIVAQGARTSSAKTPGRAGQVIRDLMLPVVF